MRTTPGPWSVEKDINDYSVVAGNARVAGYASAADACLIAAAPDLLKACKAAFVALPMSKHNEETNAMLKAAIAKAEGR